MTAKNCVGVTAGTDVAAATFAGGEIVVLNTWS